FRPIGALVVKGRSEGLPVFTPVNDADSVSNDDYMAAYRLMEAGESAAAARAFAAYTERHPEDGLAAFHYDRLLADGAAGPLIKLEGK
ncbi:MAG TPA: adenylate/guanylate cyclase domain-containing response regulator, partial [Alphaproteobacteria bacterium]|nr:adenylate/guanylate cyclase domain-containing response regulator [Alphaproteobacteria bacterium]